MAVMDDILAQACKLEQRERGQLIRRLYAGLGYPQNPASEGDAAAFTALIDQRLAFAKDHPSALVSAESAAQRARLAVEHAKEARKGI